MIALGPFSRMWALLVGVSEIGSGLSVGYARVAAVFVFIAVVEAFWFAFWHFKRIRNFKTGWRQRLTPVHFGWVTKSSTIMCMIEPVVVGCLIMLCGICVAAMWPFWVPIVILVSGYDMIHYVIRKTKRWRSADDDDGDGDDDASNQQFSFNKVKEFPWIYGDHDPEVISRISADAMLNRRTQNGGVTTASNRRRPRNQKTKNNH